MHGLELVVGDLAAAARPGGGLAGRALAQAGQYAALAEVALGEVMEIKEAPATPGRPAHAAAGRRGPAGRYRAEESIVWAAVTVTWALGPGG